MKVAESEAKYNTQRIENDCASLNGRNEEHQTGQTWILMEDSILAYIHKETFEILQGSNIDNFLDDYFEVDDAIALPIQALNRKGYKTVNCCAGHPFGNYDEIFSTCAIG